MKRIVCFLLVAALLALPAAAETPAPALTLPDGCLEFEQISFAHEMFTATSQQGDTTSMSLYTFDGDLLWSGRRVLLGPDFLMVQPEAAVGLWDYDGNELLPCVYDNLGVIDADTVLGKRDGTVWYIDLATGRELQQLETLQFSGAVTLPDGRQVYASAILDLNPCTAYGDQPAYRGTFLEDYGMDSRYDDAAGVLRITDASGQTVLETACSPGARCEALWSGRAFVIRDGMDGDGWLHRVRLYSARGRLLFQTEEDGFLAALAEGEYFVWDGSIYTIDGDLLITLPGIQANSPGISGMGTQTEDNHLIWTQFGDAYRLPQYRPAPSAWAETAAE